MAGKRRRAAATSKATTASSAAAASSASKSSSSSSSVYKTLQKLIEISESKSEETLQAFCDGKCLIDTHIATTTASSSPSTKAKSSPGTTTEPNYDTYWIVLATHIVNRLMKLKVTSKSSSTSNIMIVMAAFCDTVSKILVSDKPKLEKASHTASSRSVLARATLTTTVASLHCISNLCYGNGVDDNDNKSKVDAFQAAVSSLERLIYLKAEEFKDENKRNTNWIKELNNLEAVCNDIPSNPAEDMAVACLQEATAAEETGKPVAAAAATAASVSPPPAKRTRTRRKGTAAPSSATSEATTAVATSPKKSSSMYDVNIVHQALEAIMKDSNQRIDGRVTVKRWASMALVWLCQGQVQILEVVHQLSSHVDGGPATTTSTSKSKKKKTAGATAAASNSQLLSIEQTSHNINRLVMVASESGNHCGLRPPSGGMDQYIRSIDPAMAMFSSKSSKNVKFVRSDIRDLAVVCIDDLLNVHRRCLANLFSADNNKKVVNGDNTTTSELDTPDIPTTLSALCRAAASSVSNSTFSEQGEWTKILMSIASAKCLNLNTDPNIVLDCILTKFALTQLEDCLRSLDSPSSSSTDMYSAQLDRVYKLKEPIPTPSAASSSTASGQCTFGGMISPPSTSSSSASFRSKFDNEQSLALALRAMHPCKGSVAAKLVTTLTDIVGRVYDTRKPKKNEVPAATKAAAAKSTSRRTKRRKVEEAPPSPPPPPAEDDDKWHRITSPRALVANEALGALRHCLATSSSSSSALRRSIRRSLTVNHYEMLIGLSELLDKIVLKTRTEPSRMDEPECDPEAPSSSDVAFFSSLTMRRNSSHAQDYSHFEKVMWSAHMAMCQTLGRGKTTYDGSCLLNTPLLSNVDRKKMFKAIAAAHKTDCGLEWPLSLPAGYHAYLISSLSSEPISSSSYDAELYIAKEAVRSLRHVLLNRHFLTKKEFKQDELFLDDDIPFSHRDARTFMLAVFRIPPIQQVKILEDLVRASLEAVMTIHNGEERRKFLENGEASGFVARVLVVCTSIIDIISHGPSLRETFFASAGPVTPPLPAFTNNAEWYRCDRCFMGLFDDWESPALPELTRPNSGAVSPKEGTIGELQVALETAFELGFGSANTDHCHLLFAAWNGLGRIHPKLRRSLSLSGSSFPSFQAGGTSSAKQILQMRDDICSIHNDINEGAGRSMSSTRLKINLSLMLRRAQSSLDSILSQHVSTDDDMAQDIPIEVFSLLSALPCYISSSIAGHTKPGNDYFSTTLAKKGNRKPRRARGYSSSSEHHSDDDSIDSEGAGYDSDVKVDALSRLRECCDAFGAAPVHPDWLDVSCSLREGFRPNDAIESAQCAMATLNRLVAVAFHQYKKHYLDAIKAFHKADASLTDRINLCFTLCQFSNHESASTSVLEQGPYPDEREWKDDIIKICNLHQDVVDLVLDESIVCNVDQARESWCPNAAQRLVGKLQDRNRLIGGWETSTSELRAGGEWELLLSEALSIPCLEVKDVAENSEEKTEWDEDTLQKGRKALKMTFLWRSVLLNATSHFSPATALLRLGLNNKVGRKPHPFSFHENNQDPYDVAPLSFSERMSGTVAVSSSLKAVVYETLTLLSRLAVEGDDTLMNTCYAISSHLVVDTASFSDLEGLQSIRFAFIGLKRIRQLISKSKKRGTGDVVTFIVERLTSVIEDCGRSSRNKNCGESTANFQRLLTYFGAPGVKRADCVVGNSIELFDILTATSIKELDEEGIEIYVWNNKARQTKAVADLVSALCLNVLKANDRTRSCLALLLSKLASLEFQPTLGAPNTSSAPVIIPAIVNSFNSIDAKTLKNLLLRDLCRTKQSGKQEATQTNMRPDLSRLLVFLLCSKGPCPKFKRSRVILDILFDSFDQWFKLEYDDLEPILDVLFLYGSRFNLLKEIGSKLLAFATSPAADIVTIDTKPIKSVSKFFAFVRSLSDALKPTSKNRQPIRSSESSSNNDESTGARKSGQPVPMEMPKTCSFAQRSGFHAQHWYNCYTCGLVWDKGCCTLCAVVCHRGHDVSYSRHSSFFCDCGAEDGSVSEQTRVTCKCLAPLAAEQVDELIKRTVAEKSPQSNESEEKGTVALTTRKDAPSTTWVGVDIARDCFGDEALVSTNGFGDISKNKSWLGSLVTILRQQFQIWKSGSSPISGLGLLEHQTTQPDDIRPIFRVPHNALRKKLRARRAKALDLQRMDEKSLIPVRAAKGFQVKMSSDAASNALLSGQLSRYDIARSVIGTDSRGRLVLAEPCSLVFCSALPAVSVRYVSRPHDSTLSRHQMCVLGSAPIKFQIVGLKLCIHNERHLIVWGKSEACVTVLKADWTGVEESIELVFDLDSHEGEGSDHLVKCEWIPGSQTHLAVGCSRFVRIYDITKLESDKRALPVIGYNLGFEACLRDVSLIPYKECGTASKMFLLLENGRLHVVDLKSAPGGRLESPSDQHFEPSECVVLSTAGVRIRTGSSIGQSGCSTRSLGEGSKLAFLKQSRVLLYKCVSSCVLALMVDAKGGVEGTFELIPHTISSDVLGNGPDGCSVSGPFTHWTELGVVYREGASFFRLACVGKSSKGNRPKLLCIEFNETNVRINEMNWLSGSSVGLGLSVGTSFEGLAAFSAPFIEGTSDKRIVGERAYMSVATSNGSILFFGDEAVDTVSPHTEATNSSKSLRPVSIVNIPRFAGTQSKKPSFPLTIFETLQNVSDSESVVFGGEGIGSDPADVKSRLSRDSSSSFLCPRREGCTLTISIRPDTTKASSTRQKKSDDSSSLNQNPRTLPLDPVIAGLRILVGSTSNYIPSKIYLQGRPVDLTPRLKKWYCLPLTDEEIAMSMRNGFVTVGIGPSFDSSTSIVVDSIEVYAAERKTVEGWLPTEYYQNFTSDEYDLYAASKSSSRVAIDNVNNDSRALTLSARALTDLCELVGSSKLMAEAERDFLRQLIQDTALDRDKQVTQCVQSLLESLEPDSKSRKSFYDESILYGCSRALQNSKDVVFDSDTAPGGADNASCNHKWVALRAVVQDCLDSASSIARERPTNYLQSMQDVVESKMSSGSIAVDASKLITEGLQQEIQYEDLICGTGGIVDLSLTEMAIALNTEEPHKPKSFAKFDVIRSLLECDKLLVVERCCEAIGSFCRTHGAERGPNDTPDLFTQLQNAKYVAYACDSCETMPIKDIRYTLLDSDNDIDLCKDCFRLGKEFAESQSFNPRLQVVINGKTVGVKTKLTCVQMKRMQPISLGRIDVEQVEEESSGHHGGSPDSSQEEDEDLQRALRLSLGDTPRDEDETNDPSEEQTTYEYFVGHLFTSIVDLLASVLKRERCGHSAGPLIRLLLDMIRNSKHVGSQNDRAKRFSKEISQGISHILKAGSAGKQISQEKFLVLVTCIRSLTNLLAPEDSHEILEESHPDEHSGDDQRGVKPKEKSSPKFICETHNIPAVRRRCAKGVHKDRRFYVCGKERGQRCKYFVWADEFEMKPEKKPKTMSRFNGIVKGFLWSYNSSSIPLHSRLCRLVEDEILGEESDLELSLSLANTSSNDKEKNGTTKQSTYDAKSMERDLADGVYCSREKMQDVASGAAELTAELGSALGLCFSQKNSGDRGEILLEASLELLTLVADHQTEGISRWFSLLCEINIATNKPSSLRSMSKGVLKTLCGGNRTLYQSVRDHFQFGFQLRSLYRNASTALNASLFVKEKARQCGQNWSSSAEVQWHGLAVGDLIGTGELVSEDSYTQLCSKQLGKVLDELWSVVKNRGESWRRFCGLQSLPNSPRENAGRRSVYGEAAKHLSNSAPIMSLFWMASALTGTNQVKLLRLIDFALTNWKERKVVPSSKPRESSSDEGGTGDNAGDSAMSVSSESSLLPEDILVKGDKMLHIDGIVAFALTFVYSGRTVDIRRISYHVLAKLCDRLPSPDRGIVFQRLVGSCLAGVGIMGKACVEFLHFLQALCKSLDSSVPVKESADFIMRCFIAQITSVKYDRSNGEWFLLESGPALSVKKKFDLAECGYCVRPHHFGAKEHKASEKRESSNRAGVRGSGATGGSNSNQTRPTTAATRSQTSRKWHPEQICSFSKSHLDSLKEASASNEFCSFFSLKHRVVISDITLIVNDPRGRYVKTVTIYCSPRPVADVSELKSDRFESKWQRCATLSLTKGATRISTSLTHLMVAANLKVEYTDFYERPGGSKSSDGSLLVHCPRCTRVVTNAHGVCGNCGEVAFQCRKCRHINYDRLDAFLCVECGYCASGSFSVDLQCGVASNAIAITNDGELERSTKILDITSSIHEELRGALREKLRGANSRRKPGQKKDDMTSSLFGPALQRAFLGLPPLPPTGAVQNDGESYLSRLDKQGSVGKVVARPNSTPSARGSSTADRTRSLLRLARQIRSESGASSDRRRGGPSDALIRHLGRGLAIENLDDENDLLGLLEGGSVLDSSEPLSRAIASAQSRRGVDSGRPSGQERQANESGTSRRYHESGKELFEECNRLHMLMREAERECGELNRRIEVWKRLDSGCLVDTQNHATIHTLNYTPSHCSSCGSAVALQLLLLWSGIFLSDPNEVNIYPDFLIVLMDEFPMSTRALTDCKRQVVQEIATRSPQGAKLVLAELRKRLTATNDAASADILGNILKVGGFEMSDDYAQLAMDILASRRNIF